MSLSAVLLRMLLCVGLIFNGSGAAVASAAPAAHVPAANPAFAAGVATTADSAKPPCHGDAVAMAEAGHHPAGIDDAPMPRPQSSGGHSSDCCESGECRGDCVHQVQLIVDAPWPRNIVAAPTDRAPSMTSAHAPPILPHLIRPPIPPVS